MRFDLHSAQIIAGRHWPAGSTVDLESIIGDEQTREVVARQIAPFASPSMGACPESADTGSPAPTTPAAAPHGAPDHAEPHLSQPSRKRGRPPKSRG